jgi:hypothetical protein
LDAKSIKKISNMISKNLRLKFDIKSLGDYWDTPLEKNENDKLYIILDDHFININLEREIEIEDSIHILCDAVFL